MNIQLKRSPVVFNEESHTYELDGKRLLGITGLIHSILGLGVYPEASDYVKDHIVPRAGSRGTAVHHAIQTFDLLGVRQTEQTVNARYGNPLRGNVYYKEDVWDVGNQLDAYIRHKELGGFEALANELTVSDNERWASQIDNVWLRKETGGIWLVDTKTNNLRLYPTCGYFNPFFFTSGEDALKEYLSWQLSIYAVLFEAENPGLRVEGLACNWLREDEAEFWIIERKPDALVKELLATDYLIGDNGPMFFHPDPSVFKPGDWNMTPKEELAPIVASSEVEELAGLLRQYAEIGDRIDQAKGRLTATMRERNLTSFNFGPFTASVVAPSKYRSFDSARFKKENKALYEAYLVEKTKNGYLTLRLSD